jgi:hypothetical protein
MSRLGYCTVTVHGYERFGVAFRVYLYRPPEDIHSMSSPQPRNAPFRLHVPITLKTTILNLNILHFPCIVSLLDL